MRTEFWQLHKNNDAKLLKKAGDLLRQGELVAFPTETVYGLGANGLDSEAVKKIFVAKGRPSDNPLILHIADIEQLKKLSDNISPMALKLAEKFWPGPMTLVVTKSAIVPDVVTAGLDTVAVRFPANKDAQALIKEAGVPIAAPSANISGRPSPTNAWDVAEDMNGKIAAILDGNECSVGVESTVIDTTGEVATILRPGGITPEMIKDLLGSVVLDPALLGSDVAKPKAPGMKYRHYAPKALVYLCADHAELKRNIALALDNGKKVGVIADTDCDGCISKIYSSVENFTSKLFTFLRDLDRSNVDVIYVLTVEEKGLGLALMNRLKKAAGKK